MIKFIKNLNIIVILTGTLLFGQDYVFFTNSAVSSYWDPSLGSLDSPAFVELVFDSKFPVSTQYAFSGANSLKLRWRSMNSGAWRLGVAGSGNPLFDVNLRDTLSFYIYSASELNGSNLPLLYLQDNFGSATGTVPVGSYLQNLPAHTWKRVLVPLSLFRNSAGSTANPRVCAAGTARSRQAWRVSIITLPTNRTR